jgi:aspartyl-tRNA(Asn)/glutamyl-tRNA(Gln) amidotransferase subunit C
MKRVEIQHLAKLSRIRLTDSEIESLEGDLSAIVSYVSTITDLVGDDAQTGPQLGARSNVFRKDEITNEPNQYSEDIIAEMPATEGRFLKVKKILNTEG